MPTTFNLRPPDGGPFYVETNWDHLIREPYNAVTAAVFLLIAIYWLARLRGQYRRHRAVVLCLALLVVGGIGGTLFHGLRISRVFLVMDFLPILLITLILTGWLWWRVFPDRRVLGGALFAIVCLQRLLIASLPRFYAINASYAFIALAILAPLVLLLRRQRGRHAVLVATAVGAFAIALFFRILDPNSENYFPMGTHWLWHLFSAASVFCLIRYVLTLGG